ncbi:ester cyclase [Hyphomicrobium sp.]|uniref:ester cyclase n=1 Tax=Hyphomicrobium sp. TaxID=82 RepID=UPI002D786269|nr:ester cyclase [Hyphomicrobium sp.]HET6389092.1 ester cyclase [Hyphomicrobium sp.]
MHVRSFAAFCSLFLLASSPAFAGPEHASSTIVEGFWRDVWQNKNPAAVDNYVIDDFIITSGGKDIRSREAFKKWIADFQSKISDMKVEIIETFENADGSRVASRLRVTGKNNGMMGVEANQQPFVLTATAVWAVNAEGKLEHNWVERNAWEVHGQIQNK